MKQARIRKDIKVPRGTSRAKRRAAWQRSPIKQWHRYRFTVELRLPTEAYERRFEAGEPAVTLNALSAGRKAA